LRPTVSCSRRFFPPPISLTLMCPCGIEIFWILPPSLSGSPLPVTASTATVGGFESHSVAPLSGAHPALRFVVDCRTGSLNASPFFPFPFFGLRRELRFVSKKAPPMSFLFFPLLLFFFFEPCRCFSEKVSPTRSFPLRFCESHRCVCTSHSMSSGSHFLPFS